MVHQIILKNITEYSYIKPHIKEKDGHKDIIALREIFKNDGMLQEWVLKEKLNPKNLVYRDERKMTFEKFSTNFHAAIVTFADFFWYKYKSEAYIIDELYPQIQCPGLV